MLVCEEQEHIEQERAPEEGAPQEDGASVPQGQAEGNPAPQELEGCVKQGQQHQQSAICTTDKSNASEAGSATSDRLHPYIELMTRSKHSRVILEDDEDEEEKSTRFSKRITSGSAIITHELACKRHAVQNKTCKGQDGHTCTQCARLKIKCSKLSRRSTVQRMDGGEVEMDKKGKGKLPACSTRTRHKVASGSNDPIVLDDLDG
ncbi:hypothetical protein JVT61DRAFT_7843 [Boletus reticuloceps]|uniref:Uncharacterized protein n=1 Tax=Boletus reticuloceps TaxID=495285 RepID=A0A8I2YHJ2_9AGAM|nr:hypothetical protein JVT61DRAFT_7843 [Boletus reticuloceps]